MRVSIPLSAFLPVRRLLSNGSPMHRVALESLRAKLDAADRTGTHVVVVVTEQERQAAVAEIAGCGTPDGKLSLIFKEPAENVPTYTPPEGSPTRVVNIPNEGWRNTIVRTLAWKPGDAKLAHVHDVLAAAIPNNDGSYSVRLPEDECDYAGPYLSHAAGGRVGSVCAMFFMSRPEQTDDHRWSL